MNKLKPYIVVDAIHAEADGTGLARYAREVTRLLVPALQTDYCVAVVATADYSGPRGDHFVEAPPTVSPRRGGKNHVFRFLWRCFILPRRLNGLNVHSYYSPVPEPVGIKASQVLTVHDLIPLQYPWHHWKQAWLFWLQLQIVARKASKVIAISEVTGNLWQEWAGRLFTGTTKVVHNGISVPVNLVACNRRTVSDEPPFVVYVGDTRPYKGVDTLVRALGYTESSLRLKIVGNISPSNKQELERIAAEFGVAERLAFCGYVGDSELTELYAEACALALATRAEGFGLVPLEAMLCGTAAVVSDIPVLREVLREHASFVPVDDVPAWAKALDRSVVDAQSRDDKARQLLIDHASSFSWSQTVDRIRSELVTVSVM